MSLFLDRCSEDEAPLYIEEMSSILADQTEGEFVFHIFRSSGEEMKITDLDSATGRRVADFEGSVKTDSYKFIFYESEEEYMLFASQNTEKESQAVEALKKSLPVLSMIVFALSVTMAFFYAWYMTRPIKKVSSISKRMAGMDFSGLSEVKRTDEIGILSDSLNELL